MTTTTALSARLRVGYASGGIATGAFGTVPGLLLLPYLTDSLGISALLAGLIVFLPKAWDVVLNPITGRVSDRMATTRGTRRPFLLVGGIGLAIGFVLLFAGPTAPPRLAGVWVVAAFLLCATAYSIFQVPYVALPAELTRDYAERTRLLTWRVAILAVAILLSGATAPLIRTLAGYPAMAVFVAALILVGTFGAYAGTAGVPAVIVPAPSGGFGVQLAAAVRVPDFRALLITFGVQALAIGCLLAGVDYVARVVLGQAGASAVLFACFVGPALLVTPVWQRLADRWGKQRGYRVASVVLALGCTGLVLAAYAPVVLVYVVAAVTGIGYAGAQLFPLAMLPDTAAHDARVTGENRVGVFTGVWTAVETLGLALGPAVFAMVLALGGYRSSTGAEVTAQPASAETAITLGFSIIPAVLVVLSLIALRGYRLTKEEVS